MAALTNVFFVRSCVSPWGVPEPGRESSLSQPVLTEPVLKWGPLWGPRDLVLQGTMARSPAG